MTRATVILNPASGAARSRGRLEERIALARDSLAACGVEGDVRVTTAAGDAHQFARDAAGGMSSLVIAWGGDGTINEVASALAFSRVPLGIVPAGSGNGLARDLGIPPDATRAFRIAATGVERMVDAGEVNEHLFFNVAGIGLDATIAAKFAKRGPTRRGLLGYVQVATGTLLRAVARSYRVRIGSKAFETRALMITVANSRQFGNGAIIAPAARLDDGRLDLVVVEEQWLGRILLRLPALFRGTLRESRGLRMHSVAEADIECDAPVDFHLDGEPMGAVSRLAIRVRPAALVVRAPAVDELAVTSP